MEPMKKNKARTAITIDPDLWDRAKAECARRAEESGRKVSFSALVEAALELHLDRESRVVGYADVPKPNLADLPLRTTHDDEDKE